MSRPQSPSLAMMACRIILGGLFVFAGVLKVRDPQSFAQSIMAFEMGVPDHLVTLLAFVLPWTELIAGVLLVLGLWSRAAAMLIGLLLAAFLGGIISALSRGLELSCGCFGRFELPCRPPIGLCHVGRNLVLFGLAVLVVWRGPGRMALEKP